MELTLTNPATDRNTQPSSRRVAASASNPAVPVSKKRLWTGRIMSGFAALFLLFDSAMKLLRVAPVIKATAELGYPASTIVPIGLILLACVVTYLVPRTAILGAVLLTGYLGGAVASNLRAGNPLFSHTLFPIYFAVLIWGGLYLRDGRLRGLFARLPGYWQRNSKTVP
jgi:ABC-type transport system involved in cytochrome c biogenesis permease component